MKIKNVGISGIGSYVPEKIVTNEDIDLLNVGTDSEWTYIINMKIICCTPFIVTQDSDYSDIDKIQRDYSMPFKNSKEVISSIQNNLVCNTN